jgi:hypothetical protein
MEASFPKSCNRPLHNSYSSPNIIAKVMKKKHKIGKTLQNFSLKLAGKQPPRRPWNRREDITMEREQLTPTSSG